MVISKLKKSSRNSAGRKRAMKSGPAAPQVTTIRLDKTVQQGLRVIEAHSGAKRPLNKWVNIALAEFIDRQTASIAGELEQALRNIKAYRKADPGYKRAKRTFIDSEVAFASEDPMEGDREPQVSGPAVSMVREMLRG